MRAGNTGKFDYELPRGDIFIFFLYSPGPSYNNNMWIPFGYKAVTTRSRL